MICACGASWLAALHILLTAAKGPANRPVWEGAEVKGGPSPKLRCALSQNPMSQPAVRDADLILRLDRCVLRCVFLDAERW